MAAVFLLADNRRLREEWLPILSKKDDIQVVGCGPYGPARFDQIASTQANVVVLDSVSSILSEGAAMRRLRQLNSMIKPAVSLLPVLSA